MKNKKQNPYTPENLMLYHTALSVADKLNEDGIISNHDKSALYTRIAKKYGINPKSIFAA